MALRNEQLTLKNYVEKAMVDLPALPSVIVQVLQATEKETVSTSEIEGLLLADAAIATKLLKVVNSAYFGLPRQVGSVGQAIAILGMHQVRNLVLSVGVLNALNSPSPRLVQLQREFWEHSFAAATCAQALAKKRGLSPKDQETAFVSGLLHDVGRLFLFTLFNQAYQQVAAEAERTEDSLCDTELRILGVTHAELGGALADKWNFPQALADTIRYHENPIDARDKDSLPRLYCVHIADRLANESWNGTEHAHCWPWSLDAIQWLGYDEAETATLRLEVAEFVERSKDLLGLL